MSLEIGAQLLGAGRFHEALAAYSAVLRKAPESIDARVGLARTCAAMNDAPGATAWLSDACRVAPQLAEPWQLLAEILLAQKLYAQALPAYRKLYDEFGARDRATLLHYGFCLEQAFALEECIARYREAIAIDPRFLEAHVDLAGVLWRVGDFQGALDHAMKAIDIQPDHPYAVRILGTAMLNLNRLPEAEFHLRRALSFKPGFALAEIDMAFTLLQAGRLREGWTWYARRWQDTDRLQRPAFFQPALEWRGPVEQPLAGKRVAVYAEQGLGDVIQFVRYLPMLQEAGAQVCMVVQHELVTLVENSFPGVQCLTPERRLQADIHAALLEMPLHYGTTLDNIPAAVPYLRAPQDKAAQWKGRLSQWDGQLKIGIAWSGFQRQVNNINRAVALSLWQPLLSVPGVQFFSLQKSDAGVYTDIRPAAHKLVDLTAQWTDFSDSAAMLEQLDLVITVDTSIAHLAGALGRPVWVMLAPNADWRWLLDREDSPWYPTMRLFRRWFNEDRTAQVARVEEALRRLAGH
jgi:tetratricopeptide (TPR) repeat protein